MINKVNSNLSFTQKISFKLFVIFFLIVLLQIPLFLVKGVIKERQNMQHHAQNSISQKWGPSQYIGAPLLLNSTEVPTLNAENSQEFQTLIRTVNANSANYSINLQAEKRYLGIFEAAIYTALIDINGTLDKAELQNTNNVTQLFIPILGVNAIKKIQSITLNGININKEPQRYTHNDLHGFTVDISDMELPNIFNFSITMQVTGSKQFSIISNSQHSSVRMQSNWASPSFVGNYLPNNRTIDKKGFKAEWDINQLKFNSERTSNISRFKNFNYGNEFKKMGVKILIPANNYQVNTRTAKYSMLIILLSFAGLFLAEVFFKIKLHPFQYLLVGVSLTLFYLLLLSISEYIQFNFAFLIAALSTSSLIAGYCSVILGQKKHGIYTGIFFTILYGFIFVLVKSEDTSLLMGSIGLWMIVALVMYLTRKINWYENTLN